MIEKPNEKSEANGILQPLNDRHVLRPQVITVAMRYKRNILLGLHVGGAKWEESPILLCMIKIAYRMMCEMQRIIWNVNEISTFIHSEDTGANHHIFISARLVDRIYDGIYQRKTDIYFQVIDFPNAVSHDEPLVSSRWQCQTALSPSSDGDLWIDEAIWYFSKSSAILLHAGEWQCVRERDTLRQR